MTSWSAALALTALAVLAAVPPTSPRAFAAGWFERRAQTRRRRRDRRPTHGGLVVAVVLLAATLVSDLPGAATRAMVAVVLLAVLAGHRAERGREPGWAVPAGWAAVALAVPLCGVRAELTGTTSIDVALTAVGVLAVIAGLDAVDHTDLTAPAVAAVASAGLLAVAVDGHDPILPLAGALVGVCVGLVAHSWPPAAVRIGAIGPMVLGGGLAVVAVELDPSVASPRSGLVPLLALGLLSCLGPLPRLDRRLAERHLPAHIVLPVAAGAGAFAAATLASGDLGLAPTVALAVVPAALVVLAGRPARRTAAADAATPPTRRRRGAVALVVVVVLIAGGSIAAVSLLSARRSMERGRVAALAGLEAAKAGDLDVARARFAKADLSFADAKGALDNPVVRAAGLVPVLAQNVRAARTLADVGDDLSTTAVAIARRAGAEELRVVDGRFPVEQARSVSSQLGAALVTLRSAVARLDGTGSGYLVGQLADANQQVRDEAAGISDSLEVASEATRLLPSLLGADGDRRWMVAVMSSSELRGSGGLLGDFAELRLSGGDVQLVRTLKASDLNTATTPAEQAAALPPIYAQQYGGYHPNLLWQNLSVTPNSVTMSRAIADAYPLTTGGGKVDGVVAIDPVGLAGLLRLSGPVHVAGWPTPITSANVADVLDFQSYDQVPADALPAFQGLVVRAVVQALTSGALPAPSRFAAALRPAIVGGHLRLWSRDTSAERLITRIGADGALPDPGTGDFVQLVTQNGSEAKIDWYLRRKLAYDVTVDPVSGRVRGSATVTLTNGAPTSGVSSYIIGEATGPTTPGQSRMLVTLITPHLPTAATDPTGHRLPMTLGREDGLATASVLVVLEPGATTSIRFDLDGAVPPGTGYHLVVGHQPTRLPDDVDVTVHGARGWRVSIPPGGRASSADDGPARVSATLVPR